jgi:predicted nucleotidyltransferase
VREVRLFGSRARGDATEGSDIDLAITLEDADPNTLRGLWFAVWEPWRNELTKLLEGIVHVVLYNDPDQSVVRASCDECSVLLYRKL